MATKDEQSESTFVPRKRRPGYDDAEEDTAVPYQAPSEPGDSEPHIEDSDSVSSRLTSYMSGILKQTEAALENLLPVISEIDNSAEDIKEQINQRRELAMERRARLEQTRERFHQAANSVLEMLGLTAPAIADSGLRDDRTT